MSDFYSILRKSILDRGITEGSERNEIYAQARRAMIRRLWSFNPPLDEDEIDRRVAAFDVAVRDIEADVMAAFAETEAAAAAAVADYDDADQPLEADYNDADYDEADYDEAEVHTRERDPPDHRYAADDREREDYPVADPRRLPALIDPVAFGRQVREAGLYEYHREARIKRKHGASRRRNPPMTTATTTRQTSRRRSIGRHPRAAARRHQAAGRCPNRRPTLTSTSRATVRIARGRRVGSGRWTAGRGRARQRAARRAAPEAGEGFGAQGRPGRRPGAAAEAEAAATTAQRARQDPHAARRHRRLRLVLGGLGVYLLVPATAA